MKKYIIQIILVVILLSSCSRELSLETTGGGGTPVRFSLTTAQMDNAQGVVTRSVDPTTVNESELTDLWVVEFSSAGVLQKNTYILSGGLDPNAVDVALIPGTGAHLYFVANVGSSAFTSFSGTETAFQALTRSVSMATETDGFFTGTTKSGKPDIPMACGPLTVTVPTGGYVDMSATPVSLVRMLARINLTYNATASNFILRQIRVCNVPMMMRYTPPAAASSSATYPATLSSSTVYNTAYTNVSSNSGTLTFYVPENQRGQTTSNTTEKQKTGLTNDFPTYIELVGYTPLNDGKGDIRYRIYPGADPIKDYNVVRNTQYTVTANLTGLSPVDGRVTLGELANCYIVAPGQMIYIPIKQANQTAELGNQISDVTNSTLTTAVVWQSAVGLVTPTIDNASGCIKVNTSSTATTASYLGGNAVVAVKNSGGTILWSWHVWVSAYDPNANIKSYNNQFFTTNFMDRNLGVLTTTNNPDDMGISGLLYQWGRKDPFLGATGLAVWTEPTVYNGSGAGITQTNTAVSASLSAPYYNLPNAVQNPFTFYYSGSGFEDWYAAGTTAQNANLWSSPKTAYDPCPAGWKVPASGDGTASPWYGLTTASTGYGMSATSNGFVDWYPCSERRLESSGVLGAVNGNIGLACWSASATGGYSYHMAYNGTTFYPSMIDLSWGHRASGYSVRCVKE